MDKAAPSEFANDYNDIVNEINDFIASLDAPPLENHTKELVVGGQSGSTLARKKVPEFGVAGGDPNVYSRSRHASDESWSNNQTHQPHEDPQESTMPFPLTISDDDICCDYDSVDINSEQSVGALKDCVNDKSSNQLCNDFVDPACEKNGQFVEYSDDSNYSGASDASSLSCDYADNDSGFYSQYQHPAEMNHNMSSTPNKQSDWKNTFHQILPSQFSQTHSDHCTFSPQSVSGAVDETTPHLIPSTSIAPSHQDSHLQVNSQPRSDVLDQRFDQVGSSAHSLCQLNRTNVYDDEEPDYQEPSNIPVHPPSLPPSSPVQRRLLDTDDYDSPPSPAPEKHSLLYSTSAPKTVQSKTPLTSPKPFVDFKNKPKSPNNVKKWSDKPRLPKTDNVEPTLKNTPLGPQPSVARVPDLSILISELRSASPKSDPSPSPTYKSCARSESHSPSPIAHQDRSRADRLSPSQGTRSQSQSPLFQRAKFSDHNRVANQSANTFNNKDNHFLPRSPLLSRPTSNKLRCKSESPEHDYEPIENLQVSCSE